MINFDGWSLPVPVATEMPGRAWPDRTKATVVSPDPRTSARPSETNARQVLGTRRLRTRWPQTELHC